MNALFDKRRQRRIPVDLWIEVERQGELYFQRATNLSLGGAYFDHTIPLPVGTDVQMRFALPGSQKLIFCQGEIVNTKDLGMGVEFTQLQPEDRKEIENLIQRTVSSPS